jgi:quercetin dioxygenase-like cupin family protein
MDNAATKNELFFKGTRADAETVGPGLCRLLMGHDAKLMLAKVWFDQGAVGEVHAHPHSQGSFVLEGKFEVYVDGMKKVLGPGETFFVPSGADHGAVCLEEGILLDVFSPARADFLKEG